MIEFKPIDGCPYKYDYLEIFKQIAKGKLEPKATYKALVLDDLFFIVYFIMRVKVANHPFVVNVCQEVDDGPDTNTLDLWAREHFKSTVLTIAKTIQNHCKDPSKCVAIFSHTRPIAKGFLRSIKQVYQTSDLLKECFPEVFFKDPEKESPKWSEDDGLILRGHEPSRKEASLEAWGLVEGMPTSKHFDDRVYDDVETGDLVNNPDIVQKLRGAYDLSQNLGTLGGTHRVVGTYYTHEGLLTYLGDKKTANGKSVYTLRLKPGSEDGTANGKPVLLSQERWEELQSGDEYVFNCQQLLNPTPQGARKLESRYFTKIAPISIPNNLKRYMVIDPAGDSKDGRGDAWAIGVFAVDSSSKDQIGQSSVYLIDLVASPLRYENAIEEVVRMYLRNGIIQTIGVEKVGLSMVEGHIANALKQKGRIVSVENKSLYLLKPQNRNKVQRIVSALSWPLYNNKLYISTNISSEYVDRLYTEADKFPFWHDDILDIFAYLYDILNDPTYRSLDTGKWAKPLAMPSLGVI
jgi:hypothetical protein